MGIFVEPPHHDKHAAPIALALAREPTTLECDILAVRRGVLASFGDDEQRFAAL
jgi:hypothetical protein